MIDLLLYLHSIVYGLNNRNHYKHNNIFLWILTFGSSLFLEKIVIILVRIRGTKFLPKKQSNNVNNDLVVSFTSFPERINNVWMVVDSIMRQDCRPQHIQLWLSTQNFPNKEKDLPKKLLNYVSYGLEICWAQDDLKPHKKYLYAFEMFPEKCVVTIDDDLYYRKDMLAKLWRLHSKFPNCVCGHRGGAVSPGYLYKDWKEPYSRLTPSHKYYLTGCGGILYPVKLFKLDIVCDIEKIKATSLYTDDLWLKTMELLSDIPVVIGEYYSNPPSLPGSQKHALMTNNCSSEKGRNDLSWERLNVMFDVNKIISTK